jgi:hypothetical protein
MLATVGREPKKTCNALKSALSGPLRVAAMTPGSAQFCLLQRQSGFDSGAKRQGR